MWKLILIWMFTIYDWKMESGIKRCSCSYSKWFVKIGLTLIVVNGCMVCPTTVSLFIFSSRSKTSSSNFFFFNFRLSCFKMRVLDCCSSTRSCVIFFLFCLHLPSDSCTTIKRFSFSTSWVDTAVADCGCSLTSETTIMSLQPLLSSSTDWSVKIDA